MWWERIVWVKHKCHMVSWKLGQNVLFLLYNRYSAHGDSITFGMSSAGLKAGCVHTQRLCVVCAVLWHLSCWWCPYRQGFQELSAALIWSCSSCVFYRLVSEEHIYQIFKSSLFCKVSFILRHDWIWIFSAAFVHIQVNIFCIEAATSGIDLSLLWLPW